MTIEELRQELERAFADREFLKADPSIVEPLQIPSESKRFLSEVGLPKEPFFGFEFELIRSLPLLADVARAEGKQLNPTLTSRCFAQNYDQFMVLDSARSGIVVLEDLAGRIGQMFVNSRIEYFAACLVGCVICSNRRGAGEDPEKALRDFSDTIAALDPPAVEEWWSTVIQEFELGLL